MEKFESANYQKGDCSSSLRRSFLDRETLVLLTESILRDIFKTKIANLSKLENQFANTQFVTRDLRPSAANCKTRLVKENCTAD